MTPDSTINPVNLRLWIDVLTTIQQEFPGDNVNISTAIRTFKSILKELEDNDN